MKKNRAKTIFLILIFTPLIVWTNTLKLRTVKNDLITISADKDSWIFEDKKFKNKSLLLFFFGIHCPYCDKELPLIDELVKKYEDFEIIGIHAQHEISDKNLETFMESRDINFDVLAFDDGMRIVSRLDQKKMWLGAVPYNVFVNKGGVLEPMDILDIKKELKHEVFMSKLKLNLSDKNETLISLDYSKLQLNIINEDISQPVNLSDFQFSMTDKNGSKIPINISEIIFTEN